MKRYLDALAGVPSTLGYGLKQKLNEGYNGGDFRADLMAGLVVGVVALTRTGPHALDIRTAQI